MLLDLYEFLLPTAESGERWDTSGELLFAIRDVSGEECKAEEDAEEERFENWGGDGDKEGEGEEEKRAYEEGGRKLLWWVEWGRRRFDRVEFLP